MKLSGVILFALASTTVLGASLSGVAQTLRSYFPVGWALVLAQVPTPQTPADYVMYTILELGMTASVALLAVYSSCGSDQSSPQCVNAKISTGIAMVTAGYLYANTPAPYSDEWIDYIPYSREAYSLYYYIKDELEKSINEFEFDL